MLVGLDKCNDRVIAVKGLSEEVYCPQCWISTRYLKKTKSIDKKKLRNFKVVSFNSGEFNDVNYLRAGFFNKKWW